MLNSICKYCSLLVFSGVVDDLLIRILKKNSENHKIESVRCFTSLPCSTPSVTLLYVLYVHFCWEAPLPSGGLSQRKLNGSCWRKEKSWLFTSPTKTFVSGRRIATYSYKPASLILTAAMICYSVTDSWHECSLSTRVFDNTNNKNDLQILFVHSFCFTRRKTLWIEIKGTVYSLLGKHN